MKHTKMNFAGCELDVIMGHPDHELLFVAKQVAAAAGLYVANSNYLTNIIKTMPEGCLRMGELRTIAKDIVYNDLRAADGRRYKDSVWLLSEPLVYQMLLRGHAPQSEPFRKWVTEEVLPSIRKTGSYDIAKSETPEGQQFAEEFGKLRAEIGMLTSEDALNNLMDTVCVCETT